MILAAALPAFAAEGADAVEIIKQAFEAAKANEKLAQQYVYHERLVERRFTKRGKEKFREARTFDVTLFDGGSYQRLIAINDRPLYPETEARERRKYEEHVRKITNETPKQRRKRLARIEKGRREGERFLEEITRAFDFEVLGEETIDGLATWKISVEPRPGYKPINRETKALKKVRGTLWITKDEYAWLQADLETTGNLRYAVVFKLKKGAQMRFKQRKVGGEVWMTDHWSARMNAKITFAYRFNREFSSTYSNFRRFTTDASGVYGDESR